MINWCESSICRFNLTTYLENRGFTLQLHTHTHTHTDQRYPDMAPQSPRFSIDPVGSRLSSDWHAEFPRVSHSSTNPRPRRPGVLRVRHYSLFQFQRWGFARKCDELVVTHAERGQMYTRPCSLAQILWSRESQEKTDWWLLLSNHREKWARTTGLQMNSSTRQTNVARPNAK